MADDIKPPTDPKLASLYSLLRNIGGAISFLTAVWAFVPTRNLAGLYDYVHTSDGIAGFSALCVVVLFAWGPVKKYLDKVLIQNQHSALEVAKASAPDAAPIITAIQKGEVK